MPLWMQRAFHKCAHSRSKYIATCIIQLHFCPSSYQQPRKYTTRQKMWNRFLPRCKLTFDTVTRFKLYLASWTVWCSPLNCNMPTWLINNHAEIENSSRITSAYDGWNDSRYQYQTKYFQQNITNDIKNC